MVTPFSRNLKGLARKVTGRFTWKDVTVLGSWQGLRAKQLDGAYLLRTDRQKP